MASGPGFLASPTLTPNNGFKAHVIDIQKGCLEKRRPKEKGDGVKKQSFFPKQCKFRFFKIRMFAEKGFNLETSVASLKGTRRCNVCIGLQ